MDTQLRLEEKRGLLKSEIYEKLRNKYALELEIAKRFEELKRLEISIEQYCHSSKRSTVY